MSDALATPSSDIDALSHGPAAHLSVAATRALSDRSYDKRKSGALEVEAVVKALIAEQRRSGVSAQEGVAKVIRRLANDFILSSNSNQRKGGLIGLAAVSIGLGSEVEHYLDMLLPPILKCFDDPESRVRYYATEALYNVVKVSRGGLLSKDKSNHFNAVFHGLCKVFADTDPDVKNGAQLLDRLVKDIVGESQVFSTDGAIPMFQSYLKVKNPFIRQLLISWIVALDAIPDLDLIKSLPSLLNGILDMLSDTNKSIRESAERVLQTCIKEIAEQTDVAKRAALILGNVDLLVARSADETRAVRLTVITWLDLFVQLGQEALVPRCAELLNCSLRGSAEGEDEDHAIRDAAKRLDLGLQKVARGPHGKHVPEAAIFEVCKANSARQETVVRVSSLLWISLLLDTVPDRMAAAQLENETVATLLAALTDSDDEVVTLAVAALARVARNAKQSDRVIGDVVALFDRNRALLETRGALIVRQLCVLLRPVHVYLVFARAVSSRVADTDDLVFSSSLVQTLNVILLTSRELADLRSSLRRAWIGAVAEARGRHVADRVRPHKSTPLSAARRAGRWGTSSSAQQQQQQQHRAEESDDLATFNTLYRAWCHNPVSALCLALLGGAYGLAGRVVELLGDVEVTVDLLVDADRLVRLLESPAFLHVRVQLLRSGGDFEPDLLKALYGVLMLLPQKSDAFKVLDARLAAVSSLHTALGNTHGGDEAQDETGADALERLYAGLLEDFTQVQALHARARSAAAQQASLLNVY